MSALIPSPAAPRAHRDAGDPAPASSIPVDLGAVEVDGTGGHGPPGLELHDRAASASPSVGRVVAADDRLGSINACFRTHSRRDHPGLDPLRRGPTGLALELLQPGRRGGDLETADLDEAALALGSPSPTSFSHRVAGEHRHRSATPLAW